MTVYIIENYLYVTIIYMLHIDKDTKKKSLHDLRSR